MFSHAVAAAAIVADLNLLARRGGGGRREIAVRLIVGASVRDIFIMLSVEAAALSVLGAAAGVCLGVLCAALVAWAAGWHLPWVAMCRLPCCAPAASAWVFLPPVRHLMRPMVDALRAE